MAGNDLVFNGLDLSGKNALYAYYKSANGSYVLEKVDFCTSSYRDAQGNRGRDPLDITYSGLGYKSRKSVVYYSGVTDRHGDRGLFLRMSDTTPAICSSHLRAGKPRRTWTHMTSSSIPEATFSSPAMMVSGGAACSKCTPAANSHHEIFVIHPMTYNFGNTGAPYNDNWGNLNPNTVTYIAGSSDNGTLDFAANGPDHRYTTQLWEGSVSASGVLSNIHEAPGGSKHRRP